jgi:hypothetical protein
MTLDIVSIVSNGSQTMISSELSTVIGTYRNLDQQAIKGSPTTVTRNSCVIGYGKQRCTGPLLNKQVILARALKINS